MLVICAVLQVGLAWSFICANYSIKYCNVQKPFDSEIYYFKYKAQRELDLKLYGLSDLRNYGSYTDWVHGGISAAGCAFSKTSSITIYLFLQLMFYIHFALVAKSFLLEMSNPRPAP